MEGQRRRLGSVFRVWGNIWGDGIPKTVYHPFPPHEIHRQGWKYKLMQHVWILVHAVRTSMNLGAS
ncbi:unnamed protein product [Arabidopsis lyrata]|nr:unnamed protein product [Arabidopsis lyrata]